MSKLHGTHGFILTHVPTGDVSGFYVSEVQAMSAAPEIEPETEMTWLMDGGWWVALDRATRSMLVFRLSYVPDPATGEAVQGGFPAGGRLDRPHAPDGWIHER